MMRLSRAKYFTLLLIILALIVPAFVFAQEEGEEEETENENHPCNPLVLGLLGEMGELVEEIDCDYFMSLGIGPGQFKQAWRLYNMIEPTPLPETFEATIEDLLAYKAADFGWGEIKHAVNYSTDEVSISFILDELRGGENPVGWGEIKKASALAELESFDGTFQEALDALSELEWGELKKQLGYSGRPPWAKGGGNGFGAGNNFIPKDDDGESLEGSDNGPPYGKAKGHGKNKDKGK